MTDNPQSHVFTEIPIVLYSVEIKFTANLLQSQGQIIYRRLNIVVLAREEIMANLHELPPLRGCRNFNILFIVATIHKIFKQAS